LPQLRSERGKPAEAQGALAGIDGLGELQARSGKLKPGPGRQDLAARQGEAN